MSSLKDLKCEPCPVDGKPVGQAERVSWLDELSSGWKISSLSIKDSKDEQVDVLTLSIQTANFKDSLEKATLIGKMADEQWHHPELRVAFKSLKVEIYTHVIKGLRKADFIFAAKVDDILSLNPRHSSADSL